MGLDVTSYIIVGIDPHDFYKEQMEYFDIVKRDKNGVEYTIEEKRKVYYVLGKRYLDNIDISCLMDELGFIEINEGRIIGIPIVNTESHRYTIDGVTIELSDLNEKINNAMKKLSQYGIKGKIYLIQDVSC